MAQVLKDEIREKILTAALEEFYQRGYKLAAMRNIAAAAHIPTGLIYSYFKNKASLFDAVLRPVLYDWERVLSAEDSGTGHLHTKIHGLSRAETECLLNLFAHRKEFVILMDKSDGTKYEKEKERFIREIEEHLLNHCDHRSADAVFVRIIASNFVDGLMQVIYYYKGKEWAVMMLQRLSKMYLSGIGL